MTIDDKIRDEKLQYDNNREAAKISALSFSFLVMDIDSLEKIKNRTQYKNTEPNLKLQKD